MFVMFKNGETKVIVIRDMIATVDEQVDEQKLAEAAVLKTDPPKNNPSRITLKNGRIVISDSTVDEIWTVLSRDVAREKN